MAKEKGIAGAVNIRTLVTVCLAVAAVEVAMGTIPWPETLPMLMLVGVSRFIEGALIIGIARGGTQGLTIPGHRISHLKSKYPTCFPIWLS